MQFRSTNNAVVVLLLLGVGGLCYLAAAQVPPEDAENVIYEHFRDLGRIPHGVDWRREYPNVKRAIDNLWERNGWNDEADRYAHDLLTEITAIPPWEPLRRLQLLHHRTTERYGLSAEQAVGLRRSVLREAAGVLMKNMGVIMEQATEASQTRAEGKPFTPEQVARWTRQGQPMMEDVRQSINRLTRELESVTPSEKRRVLEADLRSHRKRERALDAMSRRWADGKWSPEEWGLQEGPFHQGEQTRAATDTSGSGDSPTRESEMSSGVKPATIAQPAPAFPTKWIPHDPTTWIAFLNHTKRALQLDPGQTTTAESIHEELYARATQYIEAHSVELRAVPVPERDTHPGYEAIRNLFAQLRERTEAILTTGQRERLMAATSEPITHANGRGDVE